jgi:hypothetical protein
MGSLKRSCYVANVPNADLRIEDLFDYFVASKRKGRQLALRAPFSALPPPYSLDLAWMAPQALARAKNCLDGTSFVFK